MNANETYEETFINKFINRGNKMTFNPWDNMTQDELLMRHQDLKIAVEIAKENEMKLRKYIVNRVFPDAKEGTNTAELGNGYQLKAVKKFHYNLIPDNNKIFATLDKIKKLGNEGAFIADRLVSWTPSFLLSEYRPLCENDATDIQRQIKREIETVLVITDGSPTLTIKEPKTK